MLCGCALRCEVIVGHYSPYDGCVEKTILKMNISAHNSWKVVTTATRVDHLVAARNHVAKCLLQDWKAAAWKLLPEQHLKFQAALSAEEERKVQVAAPPTLQMVVLDSEGKATLSQDCPVEMLKMKITCHSQRPYAIYLNNLIHVHQHSFAIAGFASCFALVSQQTIGMKGLDDLALSLKDVRRRWASDVVYGPDWAAEISKFDTMLAQHNAEPIVLWLDSGLTCVGGFLKYNMSQHNAEPIVLWLDSGLTCVGGFLKYNMTQHNAEPIVLIQHVC